MAAIAVASDVDDVAAQSNQIMIILGIVQRDWSHLEAYLNFHLLLSIVVVRC